MNDDVEPIREFLNDYVGWATADYARQCLDRLEAENERLREELRIAYQEFPGETEEKA